MVTGELLLMLALAFASRFLIPHMMYSERSGVRFGIGVLLFGFYTVCAIAMFRYICCVDGSQIADLSGSAVWSRVISAFLLTNVAVLFTACIYFFAREKRTMSSEDKMKLKDL